MCPVTPGTEKIVNGDFESGNTGFTNAFTYCAGACTYLPADQYAISPNPNNQNGGYFKNMADHSPSGTNMLVFDFNNNSQNDPIYSTTVNVTAGQVYFFSAWFANIAINNTTSCPTCPGGVYITNSPILKFRIAGVDQGTVRVDSITNDWNQYFTTWTAAATTSITIEIINLRGGMASNDLALDDISFTDGCEKISNLNSIGQSSVLPDTVYNCNVDFPYNLNPGLPGSYDLKWKQVPATTIATTASYAVPPTPANGTKYYLCYEYISGCPRMDSVLFRTTPIQIDLGSDKVICAPINYAINSGVTSSAASLLWYKDGVSTGVTTPTYNATTAGTYRVDATRPGCTSGTDQIIITSPTSSFSGTGTYCNSNNTADFSVTGSTQIKWYTDAVGGVALNPSNTNTSISLPYSSTNTTTPGCASGLYAQDVSSYPGTLMPGTGVPCGSPGNNDKAVAQLIEVNQSVQLTSFDFQFPSGWGTTGSYTFEIFAHDATAGTGPWCGSCTPSGRYGGLTGSALYSVVTPTYTITSTTIYTVATNYTLAPGRYWFQLKPNNSTPTSLFNCTPSGFTGGTWTSPYVDNTGNNVLQVLSAGSEMSPGTNNGNIQGAGNMFNIKFQVGSANTCSRLFICANLDCPAPVEYLSFTATKQFNGNALAWQTASEQNSRSFIIQRSTDGITFENIETTAAAGNSSSVISYHYLDINFPAHAEVVFYRLKQIDIDGSYHYSEIKSLSNDIVQRVNVFPNPSRQGQNLTIELSGYSNENIVIEIYDNPGKLLHSKNYLVAEGTNVISFDARQLNSGLYHLRVSGSVIQNSKFVIE